MKTDETPSTKILDAEDLMIRSRDLLSRKSIEVDPQGFRDEEALPLLQQRPPSSSAAAAAAVAAAPLLRTATPYGSRGATADRDAAAEEGGPRHGAVP